MSTPILATKLYIPPPRPKAVFRPRLIERLNEGLHRQLTLISAPAGFGKTTLISEWVAACEQLEPKVRAAWLSLDEGDNDPARFLIYLVAALQTIAPNVGTGILSLLQSPQPPMESLLMALLNDITNIAQRFILVLDDYHLLDDKSIGDAVTFLVEHLPQQMHLVITTREDPALHLARLRARGQLTELRASDLRFTPSEAAEFLNRGMGLGLSADNIAALENRTEGWIAGLQLAALSLQGHQDIPNFIRAFAGDHRYIVDYLVEEVLDQQPEPVRNFLLQTAILDRLNGPLCDAVTGQQESYERLEALERGNFFIIPLDDQRRWYRYHHLFADVLRMHLMTEQADQVPLLHQRASKWYEQNGSVGDAIHHALAAEDYPRAANLIERAVPTMRQSRQESAMLRWFQSLPDELFRHRPVLSVHYAGTLLLSGEIRGVEGRLRDAERWLDTIADTNQQPETVSAEMVVVNEDEFWGLPGWIAIYRAAIALALGNMADTVTYARQALDCLPEDNQLGRGAAAGLLGLVYWTLGDLHTAYQSYAECMTWMQRVGHISDAVGCAIALADIRLAQGRLHEAMSMYERGLQLTTQGKPALRGAADMYVGMSQLHYEHNDLKAATQYLLRNQELGEFAGMPQNEHRWRVAMARIRQAQGDLDGALDLLHEAERLYRSDLFPNVRPIAALKTRAWIAQGRLGDALGWAHEQGLSVEDDLSYLREFDHVTLVRVLLAQYKLELIDHSVQAASGLLDRLLQAAETGRRTGSILEILVLQALACQMQGDVPAALVPLERALTLAEPEGYVRMFVDEGSPMALLLEKAAKQGIAPNYVRQLLRAFGKVEDRMLIKQGLSEPLSERELEVLRLLSTDLSGPDIARELVVSISTLRTHTQNIYTKLGVNSRRAAIRRAEELDLL
ncbi:MAG: helix-turn-helix transcriptional regulator [Anaerolineae bacterium]|nr:helix-turn-helix transcriptional regulator [Anaerolineae bacterium]